MVALMRTPRKKAFSRGISMSEDHGAPMDYKAHNQTYSGFLSLFKWGTILTALTGILVVFLIAPKG